MSHEHKLVRQESLHRPCHDSVMHTSLMFCNKNKTYIVNYINTGQDIVIAIAIFFGQFCPRGRGALRLTLLTK